MNEMYSVNSKEYIELLKVCFETKIPLYVYGGAGVGKSEIPTQVFPSIAKSQNREFIKWTDLTCDQKIVCIKNPEKYFVFCDQRIGQMDMTDLRGIPNMINKEILETIPFSWIVYFTQKEASGVIFFDELNLAPPIVAGQAYQIIHDRVISDRKLSKDVWVFGAGNRACDQANVFEMPFPLRDRFCECELNIDAKTWISWASANNINPHLISFINWKESYLYKINKDSSVKNSTPRGIVRASKLIGDLDIVKDRESINRLVSISVGTAFACEFEAYIKHYNTLNWDMIYKNPKSILELSIDQVFALIGGMAEHFKKDQNVKCINKIMPVILELANKHPDIAIVAITFIKDINKELFVEKALANKKFKKIANEILKYII